MGLHACVACALAASIVAVDVAAAPATPAERPPVDRFVGSPDVGDAQLSPSGRHLAITTTTGKLGRLALVVIDLQEEGRAKPLAAYTDADIRGVQWVNDHRLVYRIVNDDGYASRLYSVKRDGTGRTAAPISQRLLATVRDGSDDVIVGEWRYTLSGEPTSLTPKRVGIDAERSVPIAYGAPAHAFSWLFDRNGRPRALVTSTDGTDTLYWRAKDADAWTPIASEPSATRRLRPIAVDGRDDLFVATDVDGALALARFDFATGRPAEKPILSAKGFDLVPAPIFDDAGTTLIGVRYVSDAEGTAWFDPKLQALQQEADRRFPGHVNRLECRRCTEDGVALVLSYSDTDPGSFHLYRATTRSWELVAKRMRDIDPATMNPLDFERIQARDGEDLPLWITVPRGPVVARPAVVLVHGGPWVRGTQWEWNAESQFLASRGYVVIEPEFRGSLGYGREHHVKGFRQWGLAMQDDVADAVQWAAGKGLVDPARVCIMGSSYGGYAALMGLVRHPASYRCAIAAFAVTDPRLLFSTLVKSDMTSDAMDYLLPVRLGDPVTDAEMLREAAPVEHAKAIRAPLLLAFGGADRRVPLAHGRAMRRALRAAGNDPDYVVYDGEGHGLVKPVNRIDFYTRVERFLAKNLQ